jgi:hypothetical protein
MSGKLKITNSAITPRDPIDVKSYCEGRAFAKGGGTVTYASGTLGVVANNNAIHFTAKNPGNGLRVTLRDPGLPSQGLSISCGYDGITVNLATDSAGDVQGLTSAIITAINGNTQAAEMVLAANEGASTGDGTPVAGTVALSGSNISQRGASAEAFRQGVTSWTANPTGVARDCCALPYGGGFV